GGRGDGRVRERRGAGGGHLTAKTLASISSQPEEGHALVHRPSSHVTRDQNHLAWDPAIPPVATVASGAIVEFDCLDASNGQLTAESTTADVATLDFGRVDQVNGPVEVSGAEPGDTLQV